MAEAKLTSLRVQLILNPTEEGKYIFLLFQVQDPSGFNPFSSLPFVTPDGKKYFQCCKIVFNDKTAIAVKSVGTLSPLYGFID